MILVTFNRAMRPSRAGDSRLLPDAVARELIAKGDARDPRDRFGRPLDAQAPQKSVPPKKRR